MLQLIKRHQLHPHAFADDIQIYWFCQPSAVDSLCETVSTCVDDVSSWMRANRLLLNPVMTQVLLCSSPRRQHLVLTGAVDINNTSELPGRSVHDLGVYIDADTAMKIHVITTVKACFSALGQIRNVRHSLHQHALLTLIRALVVSKVDYCNSKLAGISGRLMDRLQSILNAAAHPVFSVRKSYPINATASWAPLAKSSRANLVPAMRSRVSLPSGHSTAIPCEERSQDYRSYCLLLFEVGRHFIAARRVHSTSDPW